MTYKIGDIFEDDEEYSDRVLWADKNGATIFPLSDGKFQLVELSKPSLDDLKAAKRAKRDNMINSYIWRVQRYEQQTKLGLETTDTEEDYLELLNYIQFLRDLPESPDFPNIEVLTFDDWQYAKQQAVN